MDSRLIFRRQRLGIFYFLPLLGNSRIDCILIFGLKGYKVTVKVSVLQGFTEVLHVKSNDMSFDLSCQPVILYASDALDGEFCWIQLVVNRNIDPPQVFSAHVLCLSLQIS
jgi:hypothetical protein